MSCPQNSLRRVRHHGNVARGKLQKSWPVRIVRIAPVCWRKAISPAINDVPIDGKFVVPRSCFPSNRYTGPAAAMSIPLASTQPSPCVAPQVIKTGRGAQHPPPCLFQNNPGHGWHPRPRPVKPPSHPAAPLSAVTQANEVGGQTRAVLILDPVGNENGIPFSPAQAPAAARSPRYCPPPKCSRQRMHWCCGVWQKSRRKIEAELHHHRHGPGGGGRHGQRQFDVDRDAGVSGIIHVSDEFFW